MGINVQVPATLKVVTGIGAGMAGAVALASSLPSPEIVTTTNEYDETKTTTKSPHQVDRIEALRATKWIGIPLGAVATGAGTTVAVNALQKSQLGVARSGVSIASIGAGLLTAGITGWVLERTLIK